jgi:hypothetical protein
MGTLSLQPAVRSRVSDARTMISLVFITPITLLLEQACSEDQSKEEQYHKEEKQELSDRRCTCSDTCKSEYGSDKRYNEKCN